MSDLQDKFSKQFGVPPERIIVSKTLLSKLLGVDAKTIDSWSRDTPPLPALVRGAKLPKRVDWVYDIKDICEWIREKSYRNGIADAGAAAASAGGAVTIDPETGEPVDIPDHLLPKEEAERQIVIIKLKRERREHLLESNQLVYIDQAESILGQAMGSVSERLRMMMSRTIARLVRAGMARVEAERLIQEPVYEMLDEIRAIDITVDPLEADEEEAAAAKTEEGDSAEDGGGSSDGEE